MTKGSQLKLKLKIQQKKLKHRKIRSKIQLKFIKVNKIGNKKNGAINFNTGCSARVIMILAIFHQLTNHGQRNEKHKWTQKITENLKPKGSI